MALEVKLRVCETCDGISVIDYTGTYDAVENPTGYGTPNPSFSQVYPYTISVTLPNGTASVFTLDLLDDPPTPEVVCDCDGDETSQYTWTITPEDLGLTDITSGVYGFTWVAGDDGDVLPGGPQGGTFYTLMYGDIQGMIDDKMLLAYQGCDEKAQDAASDLWLKLCAAIKMAGCGNRVKAQAMIDALYAAIAQCC